MSWEPGDRTQWPYTGYANLGPIQIPPRVPFTGLVDRVTGATWFIGQNGTAVVLSAVQPGAINVKVYPPWDGPFLPYGTRLGASSGFLVLDQLPAEGANASAPVWIYSTTNPLQETWPEPSNIPSLGAPTVPGVPSTTPVPTGGGFKAFNDAMPGGATPPYLTVILTRGMVKNLAWWNGTAWVTPAGTVITNLL